MSLKALIILNRKLKYCTRIAEAMGRWIPESHNGGGPLGDPTHRPSELLVGTIFRPSKNENFVQCVQKPSVIELQWMTVESWSTR